MAWLPVELAGVGEEGGHWLARRMRWRNAGRKKEALPDTSPHGRDRAQAIGFGQSSEAADGRAQAMEMAVAAGKNEWLSARVLVGHGLIGKERSWASSKQRGEACRRCPRGVQSLDRGGKRREGSFLFRIFDFHLRLS